MMESVIGGEAAQGWLGPVTVFFQVVMIDLVLAGDNAVAVGLAAAGLAKENRRKVILFGLGAAVAMRIGFALITAQLLGIIGLLLAGGILLLWVCWKMWRDLRGPHTTDALDIKPTKSFRDAFIQILIADLSMSLDNVLAVAGAAREHPLILAIGLLLSIILMGVAASAIANLLNKHRWIGFVGLLIVLYVALHMIWEGHRSVVVRTNQAAAYNALMPDFLDIKPSEQALHGDVTPRARPAH